MDIKKSEKEKSSIFNLESLIHLLHWVEDAILVGLLLVMILMTVAQIFLRNLFEGGITWGDVLVRILVLWIGLVGAMVASRQNKHINIDVISRYLPDRIRPLTDCLVMLFTAVICSLVAWYSFIFVQMEYEMGGKAFAHVPTWVCETIIPFAFTVIALRYFILSLIRVKG